MMFDARTYAARRSALRARMPGGLIVFVGACEAAMNYRGNPYHFVQDGSFNYFFGLNQPGLIGIMDLDSGEEALFGADADLETWVWEGPTPSLAERGASIGVARTGPLADAARWTREALAKGRPVHYPPPYRSRGVVILGDLLDRAPAEIAAGASPALIRAIVALREVKGPEEIAEIESALEVTAAMHRLAMAQARPGVLEREVVAQIEQLPRTADWRLAYAVIFSKRGEILHNHDYSRRLEAGDIVVNDSGSASALGYASDISRTLPIGGAFTSRQRELYEVVHAAQSAAIAAAAPGAPFVDLHKLAARIMVEGLKAQGVFRGAAEDIVESGAYAVVFPGGLGHQMGLDVHDMESLGEDHVGYDDDHVRSDLFGMNRLRLAKPLKAGMVVTIEPGLYFIPPLIEAWAAENRFGEFIDYEALRRFADFGGMRIEDDVLITESGCRILGPHIPRAAAEVEAAMGR